MLCRFPKIIHRLTTDPHFHSEVRSNPETALTIDDASLSDEEDLAVLMETLCVLDRASGRTGSLMQFGNISDWNIGLSVTHAALNEA